MIFLPVYQCPHTWRTTVSLLVSNTNVHPMSIQFRSTYTTLAQPWNNACVMFYLLLQTLFIDLYFSLCALPIIYLRHDDGAVLLQDDRAKQVSYIPASTRRWANIGQTLGRCVVFAGQTGTSPLPGEPWVNRKSLTVTVAMQTHSNLKNMIGQPYTTALSGLCCPPPPRVRMQLYQLEKMAFKYSLCISSMGVSMSWWECHFPIMTRSKLIHNIYQ